MTDPRVATPPTPGRPTYGPAVARVAAALGRPFMPWQRLVSDVAGEVDPDSGRMAYSVVVLSVPRRAGKTVLALATGLQRIRLTALGRAWYTSQTGMAAGEQFRNGFTPLVLASPLAPAYSVRRVAGSQAFVERAGGGSFGAFPPIEHALHGQDCDVAQIDEAWSFTMPAGRAVEAAVGPAQATRRLRQTWVISAGGTPDSVWWDDWLARAEEHTQAGGRHGIALFDWGAPAGADAADPATWWAAHPALGHTIEPVVLAEDLSTFGVDYFERHILNRWARPSANKVTAVDGAAWSAAVDVDARLGDSVTYAYDVAPDRSTAAIAAVCDYRGGVLVTILAHRRGTGWLVKELDNVDGTIVADSLAGAPTAALLSHEGQAVTLLGASDMARATGAFVDAVNDHRLYHHAQAPLDDALAGVVRRPLGDVYVWSRARSDVDVSPLVAATLAVYQHTVAPAVAADIR